MGGWCSRPTEVALVLVSIPIMLLILAIATVPGTWAVLIEAAERRRQEQRPHVITGAPEREVPKAA